MPTMKELLYSTTPKKHNQRTDTLTKSFKQQCLPSLHAMSSVIPTLPTANTCYAVRITYIAYRQYMLCCLYYLHCLPPLHDMPSVKPTLPTPLDRRNASFHKCTLVVAHVGLRKCRRHFHQEKVCFTLKNTRKKCMPSDRRHCPTGSLDHITQSVTCRTFSVFVWMQPPQTTDSCSIHTHIVHRPPRWCSVVAFEASTAVGRVFIDCSPHQPCGKRVV